MKVKEKTMYAINWPTKVVYACDKHIKPIVGLANIMGMSLTPFVVTEDKECGNCKKEEKTK